MATTKTKAKPKDLPAALEVIATLEAQVDSLTASATTAAEDATTRQARLQEEINRLNEARVAQDAVVARQQDENMSLRTSLAQMEANRDAWLARSTHLYEVASQIVVDYQSTMADLNARQASVAATQAAARG